MMHSITNDRAKTDNGTKYTGIRILAVLFWNCNLAVCEYVSETGDPSGISCFCCPKAF